MRAVVFDLPDSRPFAEKTIDRFGVSGRVEFTAGDFLEDEIEGRFDVAWLSHILHGESPSNCQMIVDKAVGALEPGGLIMIHEFILNDTLDGPVFPALFSLNMLLGTQGGQSYSESELREMLTNAGAKDIGLLDFLGPTESRIITALV